MEYAGNAALAAQQGAINRVPELGRLKAASERVSMAMQRVAAFVERFDGPHAAGLSSTAEQTPPLAHYRNDIDSLFEQIDRLETVAAALDTIG